MVHWVVGQFREPSETVKWQTLMELRNGSWLGVSEAGDWLLGFVEGDLPLHKLGDPKNPSIALAILEYPRQDLEIALTQSLRERGLSSKYLDSFPFDRVILAGLRTLSDYWVGFALDWLEEEASAPSAQPELRDSLMYIVDSRDKVSQALRHRASRLLRRQGAP